MKLNTAFEDIPDDDDLLYSMEHWDREKLTEVYGDLRVTSSAIEAFVHPRTGTAARIMVSDEGEYSVQPSMGGFGPFDNVIQGDDPTSLVSGPVSVTALEIETLSEARAIAHYWMRGWVMRNSNIGEVRDADQ